MRERARARALGAAAALLSTPGFALAQQPQVFVGQAELFTNAVVIDGRGGAPRPASSILVWGGEIRAVGARAMMVIPEGTSIVDLAGSWVVPGYIDAHASPRTAEDFEAMLRDGVTAVREAGISVEAHRSSAGDPPGEGPAPLWYVGAPPLELGLDGAGLGVTSEDEAVAAVDRLASGGAAFITLSPSVPSEWLVEVTRAARRRDLPVWADRRGAGWLTALRVGVDVASPLVSGDPDLLGETDRSAYSAAGAAGTSAMAAWLALLDPTGPEVDRAVGALLARDASVVPLLASTQSPLACVPGARNCEALGEAEAEALRAAWPTAQALVRQLFEQGVRLLVGSDSPGRLDAGSGFHRELQALVAAGIPEDEVLGMATRNAAIALGRMHERGTIEAGKRADFVVLEADPIEDIRNARRISLVVQGGRAWRPLPEGGLERIRFR